MKLTLLERAAIEMLAKSMLEYSYKNYNDGSNWLSATETLRNRYRASAELFLNESYYNDR